MKAKLSRKDGKMRRGIKGVASRRTGRQGWVLYRDNFGIAFGVAVRKTEYLECCVIWESC